MQSYCSFPFSLPSPSLLILRSLGSEDGDGRENVAEKVNSRSFNLYRNYSKSITLSNVGEPSKSWIPENHIQVQKERGNFVGACALPLYIVELGIFRSYSSSDGKEMYKKAWCTCKIIVLLIKPIVFGVFLFPSPSSGLKVPIKLPDDFISNSLLCWHVSFFRSVLVPRLPVPSFSNIPQRPKDYCDVKKK